MKTMLKSRLTMLFLGLGMAVTATGCQGDDTAAEFSEAIPTAEMLALTMDGSETLTEATGLAAQGQALVGDPATFKAEAKRVMDGLNAAIGDTQGEVMALFLAATPVEVIDGTQTCQVWEADGTLNHWLLSSCVPTLGTGNDLDNDADVVADADADCDQGMSMSKGKGKGHGKGHGEGMGMGKGKGKGHAKKGAAYTYTLKGRPLASTLDTDYLVVFAGEGRAMNSFDGEQRGRGYIGFNLDNLALLTDKEMSGLLGVGYRARGEGRQLTLGLEHVYLPGVTGELNGTYRYAHRLGFGGRFSYSGTGDYLTTAEDLSLVAGQDGTLEFAKAAIGWKADGQARTILTACGGTAGEGVCVKLVQCWTPSAEVTFEELLDLDDTITWAEATCPVLDQDLGLGEPPTDGECQAPGKHHGGSGAPDMDEPDALPFE